MVGGGRGVREGGGRYKIAAASLVTTRAREREGTKKLLRETPRRAEPRRLRAMQWGDGKSFTLNGDKQRGGDKLF